MSARSAGTTRVPKTKVAPAPKLTEAQQTHVDDARHARRRAEESERKASKFQWEEADHYVALAKKLSQRAIAEYCGTDKTRVNRFVQCASRYRDKAKRPTFWEAYRELPGQQKDAALTKREAEELAAVKARIKLDDERDKAERDEWRKEFEKKQQKYHEDHPDPEGESERSRQKFAAECQREREHEYEALIHPPTAAGKAARRAEGAIRKAVSTHSDEEARTAIDFARRLIAKHGLRLDGVVVVPGDVSVVSFDDFMKERIMRNYGAAWDDDEAAA